MFVGEEAALRGAQNATIGRLAEVIPGPTSEVLSRNVLGDAAYLHARSQIRPLQCIDAAFSFAVQRASVHAS